MISYMSHNGEWEAGFNGAPKDIRVPKRPTGVFCTGIHRAGYMCTRVGGHTGRHAATASNRLVVAVWR